MATNQGSRTQPLPSTGWASLGRGGEAPSSLRSFTAALRAIAAPAFLVRPDGVLEQANETGARELQERGPALLRAIDAARRAMAAGLGSPRLDDGPRFDICVMRDDEAPAYALAVLRDG